MRSLTIIALAFAMSSIVYAVDPAASATATASVGTHTAKVSKEVKAKCKAEHKGDNKAYMECLKSSK